MNVPWDNLLCPLNIHVLQQQNDSIEQRRCTYLYCLTLNGSTYIFLIFQWLLGYSMLSAIWKEHLFLTYSFSFEKVSLYHSFFAISSLYSDNQHNFSMIHSTIHIKKYHGNITISDESIIIWAFGRDKHSTC